MAHRNKPDFDTLVRERAYQLWIEHGQPHGRADDHWAEARRLVEEEQSGSVGLKQTDVIGAGPETDASAAGSRGGGRKPRRKT